MTAAHRSSCRHRQGLRQARWLLAFGVLAMTMHMLAALGLLGSHAMAARGAGSDRFAFVAAICSVIPATQTPPATTPASQPADDVTLALQTAAGNGNHAPANDNPHDCCKLCVAAAPLLLADVTAAVPPAPTFHAARMGSDTARPATAARTAHPPRGPPLT